MDHVFPYPKTPSVASSVCEISTSPFLNGLEHSSLHKESSVSPSQIPECSVTPRGMVSSAVGSSHSNSFTSPKLLDASTCRFLEILSPRSQESTKSSLSSTYIETGSSEGDDGDIILIEISESKIQDGELRARVCRPSIEGLGASLRSSIGGSEELLVKSNYEEESTSRKEISTLNEEFAHSCCCNRHVNSTKGFVCGNSEGKSKHIQTHSSSSINNWEDPTDGRKECVKSDSLCAGSGQPCVSNSKHTSPRATKFNSVSHSSELCITQSCNVFPTMYAGDKLITENNKETERKLMHTSLQGRSLIPDAISYATPPKVTDITSAEQQNTNFCQDKVSLSRCDVTYDDAYKDKPKLDVEGDDGSCEAIPHEGGTTTIMGGLKDALQEKMENNSSKTSKKVVADGGSTAEGRLLSSVKNEAAARTGSSCTEEIYAGHRDGSAPDGSMTQGLGEGALLNSESMNLVPGDCSELEYTPSPGIYTLILNTDNTFSLVSEGNYYSILYE